LLLKTFMWPLAATVVGLVAAGIIGGGEIAAIVAILAVLEISLSFDNAVVNATILRRMNPWWQKFFLSVGIVIAVFGMRLIFPVIVVSLTAHLGPVDVFRLAIDHPGQYADELKSAHPAIAAFGGIFLLMIFLDYMFDDEREVHWLAPIERVLGRLGKLDVLSTVIALVLLLVVAEFATPKESTQQVLTAGLAGLAVYLAVRGLGDYFEEKGVGEEDDEDTEITAETHDASGRRFATGRGAFFLFLYLELIDASFSFDGVVGAFAISQQIFVIAAGLGIGAFYIRSLTVYLVRKGTLQEYIYLEHGAHWAIGALAVLLAISIKTEVPEVVTGLIGVAFIAAAYVSSLIARKRRAEEDGDETPSDSSGSTPAAAVS
jgi:uncharacterized protein